MSVKTSQYGLDLIENFMVSFRKPELNYKMIKKEFFIKDIISKAIKVCSVPFPEIKNVEINIEDFCIRSNSNYIKHVIINLIKNAYIHNGRDVKLSIRGNGKILYVIDYGLGINRKALKSIFDKFYSRHRGGVGIGLFFCKSAMEQMGGSIKCESEEGKYTKFILDFSKI
jgi:signal transduction histidine kinase